MTRYEILANNGQVLEHGFTSQKQALTRIKAYKKLYPNDTFKIRGYEMGKYGMSKHSCPNWLIGEK